MSKIAIIGGGYVGLHTALRLKQKNRDWNIKILDVDSEKIRRFNNGESPIDDFYMMEFMKTNPGHLENISYEKPSQNWEDYDIIFISLSTNPEKDDLARLNTKLIFKFSKEIRDSNPNASIVVRSTINIDDSDSIDELKLNYWPEFLSQGVETLKNINQPVNVVSLNENDVIAEGIFKEIFKGKTLIRTSTKEAVLVKILHNTLDAHLINLTNLFANITGENGADFNNISAAVEMLLNTRNKIKNPGIGYGGSCYPKDSYSLIEITKSTHNKNLIKALDDFNKEQSFAFLNKEEEIRKASKIVVLGSSFKGGTNDVTKTPTLSLRKWLNENDISYKIWEPMINSKWLLEKEIVSVDIEEDIKNSDLVIVASDWNEFNEILIEYTGKIIDLKNFIKKNGKATIYRIGSPLKGNF